MAFFVALPCRMIKRRILHCGIGRASGSRLPQQTAHKIKRSYILRHSARRHFVLLERMPAKNADAASCSAAMTINAALRMPQNPSEPPLQRGRAGKTAKTKARQNRKRALAWDGRAGGLATVLGRLADAHSFRALVGRKGGIWRRLHATVRQTPQTLSSMTGPGTRMTHPNAPRRLCANPLLFLGMACACAPMMRCCKWVWLGACNTAAWRVYIRAAPTTECAPERFVLRRAHDQTRFRRPKSGIRL